MILLAYSQDSPSSNDDDNDDDDDDNDDGDGDSGGDDDTVLKSLTDSIVNLARYLLHLMLSYGVRSYDVGSKQ